ncbi:MAG: MmgE/PrpD family protein [Rhizomicrobium sp.]
MFTKLRRPFQNVIYEAKPRVIDSLGCALGAWHEEPCTIARNVVADFSAKNGTTACGTTQKAPPDWAAFANGCQIRYFDYNDTYLSKEPALMTKLAATQRRDDTCS